MVNRFAALESIIILSSEAFIKKTTTQVNEMIIGIVKVEVRAKALVNERQKIYRIINFLSIAPYLLIDILIILYNDQMNK